MGGLDLLKTAGKHDFSKMGARNYLPKPTHNVIRVESNNRSTYILAMAQAAGFVLR